MVNHGETAKPKPTGATAAEARDPTRSTIHVKSTNGATTGGDPRIQILVIGHQ